VTEGRTALFYALKIYLVIKKCRTAWRGFLLTDDDEHRFTGSCAVGFNI
jgi:hypothetical protein